MKFETSLLLLAVASVVIIAATAKSLRLKRQENKQTKTSQKQTKANPKQTKTSQKQSKTSKKTQDFVRLYRFFVPIVNDHAYTLEMKEIENNGLASFEGILCQVIHPEKVKTSKCKSVIPLYRLYKNAAPSDHMISDNPNEASNFGYVNEGKIGYVTKKRNECGANVAIYRFRQTLSNDHILGNTTKPENPSYVLDFQKPFGYCW